MYALLLLPVIFLIASVVVAIRAVKKGAKRGEAVAMQMLSFALVCVACFAIPMIASAASDNDAAPQTVAAAQAGNEENAAQADSGNDGMVRMAAAVAMGVSGIGGGIAVAAAAPAAIGATSEDSKNFGKSLIFVALGEGIALYGLLISILILVL